MYKTVREGDASLQYTILPQREVHEDAMAPRHVKRRGRWCCGPCGLRTRPLLLMSAVVALGGCAFFVALLLPAYASAPDLETAVRCMFTLGGAGQRASVNPNVHHPPQQAGPHSRHPESPAVPEDDDEDSEDYPGQGQVVAMVSAPELPPAAPPAPAAVRLLPTAGPFVPNALPDDEEDDDDDEDDDSSDSHEAKTPRRRGLAVPPPPPGLPPSLLPQRQPPGADSKLPPLMLDPMMMGDAPHIPAHRKTNNGLYTNEDDLDHNIIDLTRSRQRASHASTRIFVEALLPSIDGEGDARPGEPAAPQRRSWMASASLFNWKDWEESVVKKMAFGAGIVVGLCVSLGLLVFVRRRRASRQHGLHHQGHHLHHHHHPGTRTSSLRRESKVDEVRGVDTTRDLLDASEEEA